jgi:hypothetical protein
MPCNDYLIFNQKKHSNKMNVALDKRWTRVGDWPIEQPGFTLSMAYQPVITSVRPQDNIKYTVPRGDRSTLQPVYYLNGDEPVSFNQIVESNTANRIRGQVYPDGFPRGANPIDAVAAAVKTEITRSTKNAKAGHALDVQVMVDALREPIRYPKIDPTQLQPVGELPIRTRQFDIAAGQRPSVAARPNMSLIVPNSDIIDDLAQRGDVPGDIDLFTSKESFVSRVWNNLKSMNIFSVPRNEVENIIEDFPIHFHANQPGGPPVDPAGVNFVQQIANDVAADIAAPRDMGDG